MGQFTFNARACHFFLVYLQRGWKCYGTSAWVKFNKQEECGGDRGICQCLTTGRSGYQSLSLATGVAEAANMCQSPGKEGATQGGCSGHSWASSRLALVSNSCCSQQVLLFNSNGKFLPWFYYKAVIKALQSCSCSSFNPSPRPSVLQSNLAEKEGRFYDARAQLSSNWHLWEMDQSQNMTKTLAGGNMLICLKNTSSQDKTVSPHPHAA